MPELTTQSIPEVMLINGHTVIVRRGEAGLHELAAYEASVEWFLGLVPRTWLIVHHGVPRVVQDRVDAPTAHDLSDLVPRFSSPSGMRKLARLIAFDFVLNIQDRHEWNWLVRDWDTIVAIDNDREPNDEDSTINDFLRPAMRACCDGSVRPYVAQELQHLRSAGDTFDQRRITHGLKDLMS